MLQLEKKHYWIIFGVVVSSLITIFSFQLSNTPNLQGNLLGTPEEFQNFITEINAKVTESETKITQLENSSTLDATQTANLQAEKAKVAEVKSGVTAIGTPTDYIAANTELSDLLGKINAVIEQLNAISANQTTQVSCPINSSSNNYKTFVDNSRTAVNSLNSKTNLSTTDNALLQSLFVDLVAMTGSYSATSTDCFQLTDTGPIESGIVDSFNRLSLTEKITTLNDSIETLNDGPIKCAKQLNCTQFNEISTITASAASNSCNLTTTYSKFDTIYGQLQSFASQSSNFNQAQITLLLNNLSEATQGLDASEASLYTVFGSSFDFKTQANQLVNLMNGTITRATNINQNCAKTAYVNLNIVTTPSAEDNPIINNSADNTDNTDQFAEPPMCPADSVYFEDEDACICIDSLNEVDTDGTCDAEIANDTADPTTDPEVVLPDETLPPASEELPTDEAPLPTDLLQSANETPSLNSNTDLNVMYSAAVQGETGAAPILFTIILIVGLFNLYIWTVK